MPEPAKEAPKETPKETGNQSFTMKDLRQLVTDTVTEAVKGITSTGDATKGKTDDGQDGTPPRTETRVDRSSTVAEAVQREIQKIQQKEAREAKDKSIDEQLLKLAEATKEKPPVERRRVHKIMGWGENVQ